MEKKCGSGNDGSLRDLENTVIAMNEGDDDEGEKWLWPVWRVKNPKDYVRGVNLRGKVSPLLALMDDEEPDRMRGYPHCNNLRLGPPS